MKVKPVEEHEQVEVDMDGATGNSVYFFPGNGRIERFVKKEGGYLETETDQRWTYDAPDGVYLQLTKIWTTAPNGTQNTTYEILTKSGTVYTLSPLSGLLAPLCRASRCSRTPPPERRPTPTRIARRPSSSRTSRPESSGRTITRAAFACCWESSSGKRVGCPWKQAENFSETAKQERTAGGETKK